MKVFSTIAILFVAALHLGFMALEMFLWDHEIGRGVFNMTADFSQASASMAQNQGLYNAFLSAGLLWGVIANRFDVKVFFLACVIVAGIFGAMTVKPSIFFIQAVPALIAVLALQLSKNH